MAADYIEGLFGPSADDIRAQQADELRKAAASYAQMTPMERASAGMYQAGAGLVDTFAPAFGLKNKAVDNARQTEEQLSKIAMSTPDEILVSAQQMTDPRLKIRLMQLADQKRGILLAQRKQESAEKTAGQKNLPPEVQAMQLLNDLHPDSQQAKDIRAWLASKQKPANEWSEPYNLNGVTVQKNLTTGKIDTAVGRAPVTRVSVQGTGGGSPPRGLSREALLKWELDNGKITQDIYDTAMGGTPGGKVVATTGLKAYDTAKVAANAIPKVDALITQLEKGDVSTGSTANLRLGLNKATALLGGKDAAKAASDTEIAEVMMSSEVFPLIQTLGIGARGMDTPAEREFLRKALTGEISLEKDTLLRMARMRKDILNRTVSDWDSSVDSGQRDKFFNLTGTPKVKFGKPAPTPAGAWGPARKVVKP